MKYSVIDIKNWDRKDLFKFYTEDTKISLNLTVDIDVSPLVKFVKQNGLKFYPTIMWIVCKVINSHKEFRYAWGENGELINWDYISPAYVDFHPEDEKFTKLTTEYVDDLFEFHKNFMTVKEKYSNNRGFGLEMPKNFFDVSCLPWSYYKSFDLTVYDEGKWLTPIVVWGKYEKRDDKLLMPLTLKIHHSVADGFHLCRFFNEVQQLINEL